MKKLLRSTLCLFLAVYISLFLSGCALLLLGAGTGAYIHGRKVQEEKESTENVQ